MPVITTFQVADCTKELQARDLPWRVRLHDACGAQTLSLAPVGDGAPSDGASPDDGGLAQARSLASAFFSRVGAPIEFAPDGRTFWPAR